ncbi:hypothetical protein SynPROS91_00844 [Synechococcus sp. PROS-9-1]|nr:hypothetical protein SynPROS91_00844 [Synechococcus sp. PROS-9-1]
MTTSQAWACSEDVKEATPEEIQLSSAQPLVKACSAEGRSTSIKRYISKPEA